MNFLGSERFQDNTNTSDQTIQILLYHIAVRCLGVFLIAAVIGEIGSLINNINASAQLFRNKLDILNQFMANKHLPLELSQRIQMYYDHLWSRQQGLDDASILKELPTHLQTAVSLYINAEIISNVPFFQKR